MTDLAADTRKVQKSWQDIDLRAVAPFVALALLLILGAIANPNFISIDNLLNVATRSAFIAIIAVGATFVITAGGLDLSVGSMSGFVAGAMILLMNAAPVVDGHGMIALAMVAAVGLGALCGLGNGLVTTVGRIEPFIVTLGTMGIFRGLLIWLAEGGSIAMKAPDLRALYRPVYFGTVF